MSTIQEQIDFHLDHFKKRGNEGFIPILLIEAPDPQTVLGAGRIPGPKEYTTNELRIQVMMGLTSAGYGNPSQLRIKLEKDHVRVFSDDTIDEMEL